MSIPQPAEPAKLVVGFFTKEKSLLVPVAGELTERFGTIDLISSWLPFDYTRYYAGEMGSPLWRRIMAFKSLIDQESLASVKLATNKLENKFAAENGRRINIDPGYLLQERFVLASGKNFTHRIYLQRGIYADLTLIYQNKALRPLPWTYPDYADPEIIGFLTMARNKYRIDLKKEQTRK